jgi:hypothetical protein
MDFRKSFKKASSCREKARSATGEVPQLPLAYFGELASRKKRAERQLAQDLGKACLVFSCFTQSIHRAYWERTGFSQNCTRL